ncbi:MAG TPA: branched-chain amino acid ABC transporter permease [Trueperaceae bacterium]|nr:branched-chain amino acid ABC transporter permease [Trueperaceae bacterium]
MTEAPTISRGRAFRRAASHALSSRWSLLALLGLLAVLVIVFGALEGIPASRLLGLTVRGILLGGALALGALGITLVFGVLKMANFAHGDYMTTGAYLGLVVMALIPASAPILGLGFGYEFVIALLIVMPLTGLVAYGLDRVTFRRLRKRRAAPIMMAMAALGLAFGVRSIIYMVFGADFTFYYQGGPRPIVELLPGLRVRTDQLFILAAAVVLIFLVYLLLERTKIGKAMRAMADNSDLARISGIATERVVFWTWLISGGLAGAGGMLYALDVQLRPEMGWWLLLPLFAAVILGSIGNVYGALFGAFTMGIVWQVSSAFVNPAYGPAAAFVVMILALLVRPQGLMGRDK